MEYEKGTGRIRELLFKLEINENTVGFKLPVKYIECGLAISKDKSVPMTFRNRAKTDTDYVYRVSWRILKDWIDAQMAIIDLEMVKIEQVFLPYAMTKNGNTVYENILNDTKLLTG